MLYFLKLNINEMVQRKQYMQKDYHDHQATEKSFDVDDLQSTVGGGPKWIPGVVI